MAKIQGTWLKFLFQIKLAQCRRVPRSGTREYPLSPFLEIVMPGLFYSKLGSLLNEFLAEYIAQERLAFPASLTPDLPGRIKYLGFEGRLEEPIELDAFSARWSEWVGQLDWACSWKELTEAIDLVDQSLQRLHLVGPRIQFSLKTRMIQHERYEPIRGPWASNDTGQSTWGDDFRHFRRYTAIGTFPGDLRLEILIPKRPIEDRIPSWLEDRFS